MNAIAKSDRLCYRVFEDSDADQLAELLADSSITRHITSNGSSAERCRASAIKRIAWHNAGWESLGYGVWALTARDPALAPAGRLLGWCGFAAPDGGHADPEILYAIRRQYRGVGLAAEAAGHAIQWLFDHSDHAGVSAVIYTGLNPGSVAVVSKLGMTFRDTMDFSDFLDDAALADEVAEYEIWRLRNNPGAEAPETLLDQAAFRAGQVSRVCALEAETIEARLLQSLAYLIDTSGAGLNLQAAGQQLKQAFENGRNHAYMDRYNVQRDEWLKPA